MDTKGLRVGHISKNCLEISSCYSCGFKHISICDKKGNFHRHSNNLTDQWRNSCNCSFNCSAVKVNNENNSSNDCTAGQARDGNISANILEARYAQRYSENIQNYSIF